MGYATRIHQRTRLLWGSVFRWLMVMVIEAGCGKAGVLFEVPCIPGLYHNHCISLSLIIDGSHHISTVFQSAEWQYEVSGWRRHSCTHPFAILEGRFPTCRCKVTFRFYCGNHSSVRNNFLSISLTYVAMGNRGRETMRMSELQQLLAPTHSSTLQSMEFSLKLECGLLNKATEAKMLHL